MKTLFIGILIGVVLVFVGYGAYLGGKNLNIFLPKNLEVATPEPTVLTEPITDVPVELNTNEIADENMVLIQSEIMQAISGKSYTDLKNMMGTDVEVLLYASECCGTIKSDAAVTQLKYLNSATSPWYFGSDNADIKEVATADPLNYGSPNIVGISSDKMVVSFKLNNDGVIQRIIIVPNVSLLKQ